MKTTNISTEIHWIFHSKQFLLFVVVVAWHFCDEGLIFISDFLEHITSVFIEVGDKCLLVHIFYSHMNIEWFIHIHMSYKYVHGSMFCWPLEIFFLLLSWKFLKKVLFVEVLCWLFSLHMCFMYTLFLLVHNRNCSSE